MQHLALFAVLAARWPRAAAAPELTAHQQLLSDLWDEYCKYAPHTHTHTTFAPDHKSVEQTMATMTAAPHVNHIPTMVGGAGVTGPRPPRAGTRRRLTRRSTTCNHCTWSQEGLVEYVRLVVAWSQLFHTMSHAF
jgi:hypothetical protein